MDRFERKKLVDKFNALALELDKFQDYEFDHPEADKIRDQLDALWYNHLDSIAEIQVDPLRIIQNGALNLSERKVTNEGEMARFSAKICDELDQTDILDATIPWIRMDLCNPAMYDQIAAFWEIDRPQDMDVHDAYWIPREIHEC